MKKEMYLIVFIFICVLLVTGCGQNEDTVDNTVYVKTQRITYDTINREDNYSGTVKGRYETNLAFQVGGKILSRNINVGDKVTTGDVLMVIDDRDIRQNLNMYNAQVQSAKTQMDLAASDLTRYQQLYAVNAVSTQALDQYQSAYNNAIAMYNQAVAQASQGQNALTYTQLTVDKSGIISSVTGEAGQVVSAGQTVATLVQDGEREIEISVPENKIQTINLGQTALVSFWALNNLEIQGSVREIAPMADAVSRTYKVRIALNEAPGEMQLGMTANVLFDDINNEGNSIILPLSALYQTEDKTQVWLVNSESKVELKDIKVISLGKNDVIVSGLNKGDVIVTAGVHKLYAGQTVKIAEGDTL